MAVVNVTESPVVSASRKFGEPPTFSRKWIVEVDDPQTTQTTMLAAVGVSPLDSHPEAAYCRAMTASLGNYNGSRWHYELTWEYELPKQENPDPNPLARPDIWKWSTGGLTVPALYYYDGSDTLQPLQNTANDFFEGATTDLSTLQASISGNRSTFDYGLATTVTNTLNSDTFLGCPAYTWKCSGIAGQPAVEVVNDVEVRYWQVEVTLEYRPDKWTLQLPNVGWNYISGGIKKRAYVIDTDSGDKVPSSNPQPLDNSGGIITGAPTILERRVHKAVAFASYFGTPPAH
jgi:hypothetical protein